MYNSCMNSALRYTSALLLSVFLCLSRALREGMEESYETFEEELGPPRAEPPPQKPVRQIRRPGGSTHTHKHTRIHAHDVECAHTKARFHCGRHIMWNSINTLEQQHRESLKYDSWSEGTAIMEISRAKWVVGVRSLDFFKYIKPSSQELFNARKHHMGECTFVWKHFGPTKMIFLKCSLLPQEDES